MKTKQLLNLITALLLFAGWQASAWGQDFPANQIQNPNMEHELNAIFWYGSCCDAYGTNGIANFSQNYMTTDDAHSGNQSFFIPEGSYVWVSYSNNGLEEKKMKASFWYKGSFANYWNFVYRDVGIDKDNELPPQLAEYTGADSAFYSGEGQDALQFSFGGDDDWTEDWTYFEFVWDMPGTIAGWGNTSMWWAWYEPAYLDDFYYGEWFDGQYMGEEPFEIANGDFESTDLPAEWVLNVAAWDVPGKDGFLTYGQNHTDGGLQSLRLLNYKSIGESGDTSDVINRNATYYLPALGAEGENMEMSFWYMGNDAKVSLEFYDDYGVTTDELPLPDGAMLYADSANPVYVIDTLSTMIDTLDTFIDTFTVTDMGNYQEILAMHIDTMAVMADSVLIQQDFDDAENQRLPNGAWVWSGSNNWEWDDWAAATKEEETWTDPEALWLPGDPEWGGMEGYVNVVDNTSYSWEFYYRGRIQFILMLGAGTKYDLINDPDGIVPQDPRIDSVTADAIYWTLDSDYWKRFYFEYAQGSWLADSAVDSPASLTFDMIGTYDSIDVGYVDDIMIAMGSPMEPVVDTNYVVVDVSYDIEITHEIDTSSTTYNQMGAMWYLPAAEEWTEWKLDWTNPGGDIGGTLTLMMESETVDDPFILPFEGEDFEDENAGWTYFDDFVYKVAEPEGINKDLVQYDLYTYPNPASNELYLSIEIPLERIDIYNAVGQLQMSIDHPVRILDISTLDKGLFFINVMDELGVVHKAKFIKY